MRPAFAMTINKSQGQTFKHIGIFLRESVFSHGQLYVALSRVGTRSGVHIMVKDGWKEGSGDTPPGVYTENIVFHEVFNSR